MTTRKKKDVEKAGFYGEAPFWSWNDRLDAGEACRQIDEMAAGGWGGFFMHSRVGLVTEYMGREWMEVVKACVARAKKLGMCAYLYDEDCWPSGFAGGAVPKKGAKYRGKRLLMSENLIERGGQYKLLGSYRVGAGEGADAGEACLAPTGETGRVYHLYQYTLGLGDGWFHGASYVDLLDAEVTDEFIRVTHEKYKAAVGKEFGKTIPGIFTDEPSLPMMRHEAQPIAPWTPKLPAEFKKRRGYALDGHLLSLFLECGDWRKIRYDFYRTVTELFVENYTKRLYDWCESNNLALTGHMMAEDMISGQVLWGGAAMPHYEYMHMPGMDHLGRNVDNASTAKQVSSVAEQLGRKRVMSELYGCSGQDFDLKGRKWIADWHFALGVNLLTPHLWLYSMRGRRKRDFPPTISYQQPHWRMSKTLSERNATLSYLFTQGKRVVDVLVVHPVESGWCLMTPVDEEALDGADAMFAGVIDELLKGHVDFHFGDESLMEKYASVEDGKVVVGEARYSVVVVPACLTLRESTARLLGEFVAAGGSVVVVERRPTLVEGSREGAGVLRKALGGAEVVKLGGLARRVRKLSEVELTIGGANAGKVLYHLREVGGERCLFLANTDYKRGATCKVQISGAGRYAGRLDLGSGEITGLSARRAGGGVTFTVGLAEAGSAMIVVGEKAYPAAAKERVGKVRRVALSGEWRVKACGENALTVDYARIPRASYTWTEPEYVLFAAEELKGAGGTARARYEFRVGAKPKGAIYVAVEQPETWEMEFNGTKVGGKDCGPFVDEAFRRIEVTGLVREGRNVFEVAGRVGKDFELESVYVVGRFGVYLRGGRFVLGAPAEVVSLKDLTPGGFSFFAGVVEVEREVTLLKKPSSATLRMKELWAGAAEVIVNGRHQGELLYPPYEVGVKGLKAGKNRIVLRLYSTLRNLLGPHHLGENETQWASPGAFVDRKRWTDKHSFVKFGAQGAELLLR